jgi:hypothetical protein
MEELIAHPIRCLISSRQAATKAVQFPEVCRGV